MNLNGSIDTSGPDRITSRRWSQSSGRVRPIATGRFLGLVRGMEAKQKGGLTYSESLTTAYQLWGAGQVEKMMQLAIDAHLGVFPEQPQVLIPSAKGIST
jgi:hypothetical protein